MHTGRRRDFHSGAASVHRKSRKGRFNENCKKIEESRRDG